MRHRTQLQAQPVRAKYHQVSHLTYKQMKPFKTTFLSLLVLFLFTTIHANAQHTRTMYDQFDNRVLTYSYINDIVPDCSVPNPVKAAFPAEWVFYNGLFSDACKEHDWGWSHAPWQEAGFSGTKGKDIADERFLVNMRRACDARFASSPTANLPQKSACYAAAQTWYIAVKNKVDPDWQKKQSDFSSDPNVRVLYSNTSAGNNGEYRQLATNWSGTEAMCSMNGSLYAVQGSKLWRTSTSGSSTALASSWGGTEAMCSMSGYIYAVQGGKLWKVGASGKGAQECGSGWGGTEAMASMGGYIYAVQGGKLWKVGSTGKGAQACGSGWGGTEAMASLGGSIYAVQGGTLWRVGATGKNAQNLGGGWQGTKALAADGKYLYALQGGKLWRFDPSTRKSVEMKRQSGTTVKAVSWSYPEVMTTVGSNMYIVQGGKLWQAKMY